MFGNTSNNRVKKTPMDQQYFFYIYNFSEVEI